MRYRRRRAVLLQFVEAALARGAAGAAARDVDPADPLSWEFSGFSQNGEDGILDYLTRRLLEPNRCFLEIGAGDGRENNSSWLAVVRRYGGIMVDADPLLADAGARLMGELTPYVEFCCALVGTGDVAKYFFCRDPDVFSIDIDGDEQDVIAAALDAGLRPAVVVTEFDFGPGPGPVGELRSFMEGRGYRFVTVESNAVNVFFLDPGRFEQGFVDGLRGADYRDNVYQRRKLAGKDRQRPGG